MIGFIWDHKTGTLCPSFVANHMILSLIPKMSPLLCCLLWKSYESIQGSDADVNTDILWKRDSKYCIHHAKVWFWIQGYYCRFGECPVSMIRYKGNRALAFTNKASKSIEAMKNRKIFSGYIHIWLVFFFTKSCK